MRVLLARGRRLGAEPSTRRVFVLEVTEAFAFVQVFAVGRGGLAFAVDGTGSCLATAALAAGLGCGSEADCGSEEDILEQHVGCVVCSWCSRELVLVNVSLLTSQ